MDDRDLLGLKLDLTITSKQVLVDKTLVARAERVYNEVYYATEREMSKDKPFPNKGKKKKTK